MSKIALITVRDRTGWAYLAELLLKKGYVVHGNPTKTFCAESSGSLYWFYFIC